MSKPTSKSSAPQRPRLRVLVVEHSQADVELCVNELERAGFAVSADMAETPEQFTQRLGQQEYDIVLADYRLPDWTGMDALKILREQGKSMPFILVTGTLGEERAVEAIKQGATDYVLKDHLGALSVAVHRALEEQKLRSDRQRSEEALRRSEANYRSLVQAAPYGIYVCTADGSLHMVNRALVAMLGYESESEVLALNLADDIYFTVEERARLLSSIPAAGEFRAQDVRWKRKDGKPITVRLSGRPMDSEAAAGRFMVMAEDVTERRLLEQQFRQAQKMEAIGQLAGGVAHDFNNLLMVISSFTELVSESGPINDDQKHHLEEVLKASRRAAGLTRQLLAFSRKQVLAPSVLDLNSVIADLGKMLPRLIGAHIKVQMPAKATDARVEADRGQLEQILMNLAVNARDAMPNGGTLILEVNQAEFDTTHIGPSYKIPPGSYVMLAVSDTGEGMDAETQSHIFEPFFTTKERGKGTGLGLATVYGIVKQSGGYISVYSEMGVGTTIKMYFPRADKALPTDPNRSGESRAAGGKETILLVEDEQALRIAAREFLQRRGYTVLQAADGAEALRVHAQHTGRIHLLVTDVVMPGGTGLELAEKLENLNPRLRVLYISGYTGGSVGSVAGLEAGASFLQKPFALETLARKVREVLDAAAQRPVTRGS